MTEIDELRNELIKAYESSDSTEQAVERLIGIYEHSKSLQSALDDIGKQAKERLAEIIAETGVMEWDTASGKCYVAKPGVTVRWDRKGLDALMKSSDEVERMLSPFRKESERPGVLTIRAAKK